MPSAKNFSVRTCQSGSIFPRDYAAQRRFIGIQAQHEARTKRELSVLAKPLPDRPFIVEAVGEADGRLAERGHAMGEIVAGHFANPFAQPLGRRLGRDAVHVVGSQLAQYAGQPTVASLALSPWRIRSVGAQPGGLQGLRVGNRQMTAESAHDQRSVWNDSVQVVDVEQAVRGQSRLVEARSDDPVARRRCRCRRGERASDVVDRPYAGPVQTNLQTLLSDGEQMQVGIRQAGDDGCPLQIDADVGSGGVRTVADPGDQTVAQQDRLMDAVRIVHGHDPATGQKIAGTALPAHRHRPMRAITAGAPLPP